MRAEDGWVVRIRPPLGRLTQVQATGIADLADRHASGCVELTARANLQLRGVTDEGYPPLLAGLQALGLVDADVQTESRRNLLLTPFWRAGDGTTDIAEALTAALADAHAPALPGKFGFALDTGEAPVLRSSPADIRIERSGDGFPDSFVVYADGFGTGAQASADAVVPLALALAHWFAASATVARRMATLAAAGARLPDRFGGAPVPIAAPFGPPLGSVAQGYLAGFEFGQVSARTLAELAGRAQLRLTPWRSLLLEDITEPPDLGDAGELITRSDDSRLRIHACTGAPGCAQANGPTRPLARALAASLPAGRSLHVAGCAKGCAHPAAAVTVVAAAVGYDLIHHGNAASPPDARDLGPADIATRLHQLDHATSF